MKYFFKGFKKGMETFGLNISMIVNSILLAIVYLIGVGITSIIAKISGKHFLESDLKAKLSKTKPSKASYWTDLNLKKEPVENYYRQF